MDFKKYNSFFRKHFNLAEFLKKHSIPAYRRSYEDSISAQIRRKNEEARNMMKNLNKNNLMEANALMLEEIGAAVRDFEQKFMEESSNKLSGVKEQPSSVKVEGAALDSAMLQRMMAKKSVVSIFKAGTKYENEFRKFLFKELNNYSTKVPEKMVVNTVDNMTVYMDEIIPIVSAIQNLIVFNYATADVEKIFMNTLPSKHRVVIHNTELFKELVDLIFSHNMDVPEELIPPYLEKVKEYIAQYIPDYYYGLYGYTILLFLTKWLKYVMSDLKILDYVVEILIDFIDKTYSKFRVGTDSTEDKYLKKAAVAYVIMENYFDVKNPEMFLTSYLKGIGAPDKKIKEVIGILKELKIGQYKTLTHLPILLKNLGFYTFSPQTFISEFINKFGITFSYISTSYPHLVSLLIISQYPFNHGVPVVVSGNKNKELEKYVIKTYVDF